jgi:hypothetical protein
LSGSSQYTFYPTFGGFSRASAISVKVRCTEELSLDAAPGRFDDQNFRELQQNCPYLKLPEFPEPKI